jgi:hypothetical protein
LRITYEVGIDDAADFVAYRLSTPMKVGLRWGVPLIAIGILTISGMTADTGANLGQRVISTVITAGLFALFWFWLIRWRERRVRDRLTTGDGAIGRHELILTDESLIEETAVNTTAHALDGMVGVVRRPRHTLIYVAPGQAHVIPDDGIVGGDHVTFSDAVEASIRNARALRRQ